MERIEHHKIFGGEQNVYRHRSEVLNCDMNFAVYIPPHAGGDKLPVLYWLSGLTCTEQNFITKAGAQRYAAEQGVILVAPDTSPRGENVADDTAYDLGKGAGFYVNATQQPWSAHYRMYDYIVDELPALIDAHFSTNGRQSIMGHSMGGHGALVIALRNTERYISASAFSPIVAPSQVPWGQKAFSVYLGDDVSAWQAYDATDLIARAVDRLPILIDQGDADEFLQNQLKLDLFSAAARQAGYPVEIRLQSGYDHSYYFISSFIGEHIAWHAAALQK